MSAEQHPSSVHGAVPRPQPRPGRLRRWLDALAPYGRRRRDLSPHHWPSGEQSVAVIGLGRFGGQVASALTRLGHKVLGLDSDPQVVRRWSQRLDYAAEVDSTNETALRQLGIPDFQAVVVGIGTHIEASVLTVVALAELGVTEIWAKAINTKHGKILSAVGARHVIFPEAAMGERVAHLITSRMFDFIELDDGFALAKTCAPPRMNGRSLRELTFRTRYGVQVIAVRGPDGRFSYATPETVVPPDSMIIVAGPTAEVERFSAGT